MSGHDTYFWIAPKSGIAQRAGIGFEPKSPIDFEFGCKLV